FPVAERRAEHGAGGGDARENLGATESHGGRPCRLNLTETGPKPHPTARPFSCTTYPSCPKRRRASRCRCCARFPSTRCLLPEPPPALPERHGISQATAV